MKRVAAIVLVLLLAQGAGLEAQAQKACELVEFDYQELSLGTDELVRIQWAGAVESFLTYNHKCEVVLALTMEGGEVYEFATEPLQIQGLETLEVSSEFTTPRAQWDNATGIAVDARRPSEKGNEEPEELAPLELCIRKAIADLDSYPALKESIAVLQAELPLLEAKLIAARRGAETEDTTDPEKRQALLGEKKVKLEELLKRLEGFARDYCEERGY